jgi:exodeoxyribonuclease-3
MKILSLNVNGLKAFYNRSVLDRIISKHSPDILCLQETKCTDSYAGYWLCEYSDYSVIAAHNYLKSGYSGVAMMVKNELLEQIINIKKPIILKNNEYAPGRVITLEFDTLYVTTVYTLNSGSDKYDYRIEWDEAFINYLSTLKDKPNIVLGDMNVCHSDMDHYHFDKYFDTCPGLYKVEIDGFTKLLNNLDLVDTYRKLHPDSIEYSWFSYMGKARENGNGWRLDYALASKSLMSLIKDSFIDNEEVRSDHSLIGIELSNQYELTPRYYTHYRKGGKYRVISTGKVQIKLEWLPCITYENEQGERFTRELEDFKVKFKTLTEG